MSTNRVACLAIACAVAMGIVGCDRDPYNRKLPTATPTPGEIQSLSAGLPLEDGALFERWRQRVARGETYVGEPTPTLVRNAIRNQLEFERFAEEEAAEIRRKETEAGELRRKEEERRRLAEEQVATIAEQRRMVHLEIAKRLDGKALSFATQAQFDAYGRPVGQFFKFKLQFRNRTDTPVIGVAGYINLRDAFGNDLGSYPFRFEPQILPGQTIDWNAFLVYDRSDPRHVAMKESTNLFHTWFFESIVFQDGTRIDRESVFPSRPSTPPRSTSEKQVL